MANGKWMVGETHEEGVEISKAIALVDKLNNESTSSNIPNGEIWSPTLTPEGTLRKEDLDMLKRNPNYYWIGQPQNSESTSTTSSSTSPSTSTTSSRTTSTTSTTSETSSSNVMGSGY